MLPISTWESTFKSRYDSADSGNILITIAGTGSGKSTQLPIYCAEKIRQNLPSAQLQQLNRRDASMGAFQIQVNKPFNSNNVSFDTALFPLVVTTQPNDFASLAIAVHVAEKYETNTTNFVKDSVYGYLGRRVGLITETMCIYDPQYCHLVFITDRALVKIMSRDRDLKGVSTLMVDEAHERSLYSDVIMSLAKSIRKNNPQFKIIISSATINELRFLSFMFDEGSRARLADLTRKSILNMTGTNYTVDEIHLDMRLWKEYDETLESYLQDIMIPTIVSQLLAQHIRPGKGTVVDHRHGDVLIFVRDRHMVFELIRVFKKILDTTGLSVEYTAYERDADTGTFKPVKKKSPLMRSQHIQLVPLYVEMSQDEREYALKMQSTPQKKSRQRVIYVSDNIAETSITIPSVTLVVDTGRVLVKQFDINRRLTTLDEVYITRDRANQRRGRAGRTKDGTCVRLYTEDKIIHEHTIAEIRRVALDSVVLLLAKMQLHPLKLNLIDPPVQSQWVFSIEQLARYDCIRVTNNGVDVLNANTLSQRNITDDDSDVATSTTTMKYHLSHSANQFNITPKGELFDIIPFEPEIAQILFSAASLGKLELSIMHEICILFQHPSFKLEAETTILSLNNRVAYLESLISTNPSAPTLDSMMMMGDDDDDVSTTTTSTSSSSNSQSIALENSIPANLLKHDQIESYISSFRACLDVIEQSQSDLLLLFFIYRIWVNIPLDICKHCQGKHDSIEPSLLNTHLSFRTTTTGNYCCRFAFVTMSSLNAGPLSSAKVVLDRTRQSLDHLYKFHHPDVKLTSSGSEKPLNLSEKPVIDLLTCALPLTTYSLFVSLSHRIAVPLVPKVPTRGIILCYPWVGMINSNIEPTSSVSHFAARPHCPPIRSLLALTINSRDQSYYISLAHPLMDKSLFPPQLLSEHQHLVKAITMTERYVVCSVGERVWSQVENEIRKIHNSALEYQLKTKLRLDEERKRDLESRGHNDVVNPTDMSQLFHGNTSGDDDDDDAANALNAEFPDTWSIFTGLKVFHTPRGSLVVISNLEKYSKRCIEEIQKLVKTRPQVRNESSNHVIISSRFRFTVRLDPSLKPLVYSATPTTSAMTRYHPSHHQSNEGKSQQSSLYRAQIEQYALFQHNHMLRSFYLPTLRGPQPPYQQHQQQHQAQMTSVELFMAMYNTLFPHVGKGAVFGHLRQSHLYLTSSSSSSTTTTSSTTTSTTSSDTPESSSLSGDAAIIGSTYLDRTQLSHHLGNAVMIEDSGIKNYFFGAFFPNDIDRMTYEQQQLQGNPREQDGGGGSRNRRHPSSQLSSVSITEMRCNPLYQQIDPSHNSQNGSPSSRSYHIHTPSTASSGVYHQQHIPTIPPSQLKEPQFIQSSPLILSLSRFVHGSLNQMLWSVCTSPLFNDTLLGPRSSSSSSSSTPPSPPPHDAFDTTNNDVNATQYELYNRFFRYIHDYSTASVSLHVPFHSLPKPLQKLLAPFQVNPQECSPFGQYMYYMQRYQSNINSLLGMSQGNTASHHANGVPPSSSSSPDDPVMFHVPRSLSQPPQNPRGNANMSNTSNHMNHMDTTSTRNFGIDPHISDSIHAHVKQSLTSLFHPITPYLHSQQQQHHAHPHHHHFQQQCDVKPGDTETHFLPYNYTIKCQSASRVNTLPLRQILAMPRYKTFEKKRNEIHHANIAAAREAHTAWQKMMKKHDQANNNNNNQMTDRPEYEKKNKNKNKNNKKKHPDANTPPPPPPPPLPSTIVKSYHVHHVSDDLDEVSFLNMDITFGRPTYRPVTRSSSTDVDSDDINVSLVIGFNFERIVFDYSPQMPSHGNTTAAAVVPQRDISTNSSLQLSPPSNIPQEATNHLYLQTVPCIISIHLLLLRYGISHTVDHSFKFAISFHHPLTRTLLQLSSFAMRKYEIDMDQSAVSCTPITQLPQRSLSYPIFPFNYYIFQFLSEKGKKVLSPTDQQQWLDVLATVENNRAIKGNTIATTQVPPIPISVLITDDLFDFTQHFHSDLFSQLSSPIQLIIPRVFRPSSMVNWSLILYDVQRNKDVPHPIQAFRLNSGPESALLPSPSSSSSSLSNPYQLSPRTFPVRVRHCISISITHSQLFDISKRLHTLLSSYDQPVDIIESVDEFIPCSFGLLSYPPTHPTESMQAQDQQQYQQQQHHHHQQQHHSAQAQHHHAARPSQHVPPVQKPVYTTCVTHISLLGPLSYLIEIRDILKQMVFPATISTGSADTDLNFALQRLVESESDWHQLCIDHHVLVDYQKPDQLTGNAQYGVAGGEAGSGLLTVHGLPTNVRGFVTYITDVYVEHYRKLRRLHKNVSPVLFQPHTAPHRDQLLYNLQARGVHFKVSEQHCTVEYWSNDDPSAVEYAAVCFADFVRRYGGSIYTADAQCTQCNADLTGYEIKRLEKCGHVFCQQCVVAFATSAVQRGEPVCCPHNTDPNNQRLVVESAGDLVSDDVKNHAELSPVTCCGYVISSSELRDIIPPTDWDRIVRLLSIPLFDTNVADHFHNYDHQMQSPHASQSHAGTSNSSSEYIHYKCPNMNCTFIHSIHKSIKDPQYLDETNHYTLCPSCQRGHCPVCDINHDESHPYLPCAYFAAFKQHIRNYRILFASILQSIELLQVYETSRLDAEFDTIKRSYQQSAQEAYEKAQQNLIEYALLDENIPDWYQKELDLRKEMQQYILHKAKQFLEHDYKPQAVKLGLGYGETIELEVVEPITAHQASWIRFATGLNYFMNNITPNVGQTIQAVPPECDVSTEETFTQLKRFFESGRYQPVFAYHGSPVEVIDTILRENLSPQFRGKNGQVHGVGEYFSMDVNVSYAYSGQTHIMLFLLLKIDHTHPGYCYVLNNPKDYHASYCLPIGMIRITSSSKSVQLTRPSAPTAARLTRYINYLRASYARANEITEWPYSTHTQQRIRDDYTRLTPIRNGDDDDQDLALDHYLGNSNPQQNQYLTLAFPHTMANSDDSTMNDMNDDDDDLSFTPIIPNANLRQMSLRKLQLLTTAERQQYFSQSVYPPLSLKEIRNLYSDIWRALTHQDFPNPGVARGTLEAARYIRYTNLFTFNKAMVSSLNSISVPFLHELIQFEHSLTSTKQGDAAKVSSLSPSFIDAPDDTNTMSSNDHCDDIFTRNLTIILQHLPWIKAQYFGATDDAAGQLSPLAPTLSLLGMDDMNDDANGANPSDTSDNGASLLAPTLSFLKSFSWFNQPSSSSTNDSMNDAAIGGGGSGGADQPKTQDAIPDTSPTLHGGDVPSAPPQYQPSSSSASNSTGYHLVSAPELFLYRLQPQQQSHHKIRWKPLPDALNHHLCGLVPLMIQGDFTSHSKAVFHLDIPPHGLPKQHLIQQTSSSLFTWVVDLLDMAVYVFSTDHITQFTPGNLHTAKAGQSVAVFELRPWFDGGSGQTQESRSNMTPLAKQIDI